MRISNYVLKKKRQKRKKEIDITNVNLTMCDPTLFKSPVSTRWGYIARLVINEPLCAQNITRHYEVGC